MGRQQIRVVPRRRPRRRLAEGEIEPEELEPDSPEPTAQPRERFEVEEDDDERLVPIANVGGAAPTSHGADAGGDEPGEGGDVLSNLAEPEPPAEPPEVGAVHVRHHERGERRKKR